MMIQLVLVQMDQKSLQGVMINEMTDGMVDQKNLQQWKTKF